MALTMSMAGRASSSPKSSSKSPSKSTKTTPRSTSRSPSKPKSKNATKATSIPPVDTKVPVEATHFGIELEFIFAFKEDLLQATLSKHGVDADVVKTLSSSEHRRLLETIKATPNPAYLCRERYPSWVLHVPESDQTCQKNRHQGMFFNKSGNERKWLRRYLMEPLLIAKDKLDGNGLDSNIAGWIYPFDEISFPQPDNIDQSIMLHKEKPDYTKWTLTNDHTIIGALPSQLRTHLQGRKVPDNDIANWDSYGIEMISPVYELKKKKEAMEEIRTYLKALNTVDSSTFGSTWTSIHVHIGFNFEKFDDMPTLVLQHLAYILVLHEDLLSKCHPRARSGIPLPKKAEPEESEYIDDEEDFDPNAPWELPPQPTEEELEQENENAVRAFEGEYTGVYPGAENVNSNARYLRKQLASRPAHSQDQALNDAIFKKDGTIYDLVDVFQHKDNKGRTYRGYMYNFANLVNLASNEASWKSIKPTVEFRQHACALDISTLKHWVSLLEAIVRKAEKMAKESTGGAYAEIEAGKYPVATGAPWPHQDMKSFCTTFLGLSNEDGDYWQARFEKHKDDRPDEVEV